MSRNAIAASALQFFSVYQGCPNTARLPEFLVSLDSNASFVTTDVVRGGGAAAAVAFREASFNLILPNAQFRLQNTTFWYARGGHSGALAVIADAESRVAAGRLQWAYGAAVNPNGTYPESSWSGMLAPNTTAPIASPGSCRTISDNGVAILEGAERADPGSRSAEAEPDGDAPGAGSEVTSARDAAVLAAACCAVVLGLLLMAFMAAVVMKGRRGRQRAAREAAWKALEGSRGGGVLYARGASSATLDVRSSTAGSSMRGLMFGHRGLSFSSQGQSPACETPVRDVWGPGGPQGRGRVPGERSTPSGILCEFSGGVPRQGGAASPRSAANGVGGVRGGLLQEMQAAQRAEIADDSLEVYGVIGRGGRGNVYRGPPLPPRAELFHTERFCACREHSLTPLRLPGAAAVHAAVLRRLSCCACYACCRSVTRQTVPACRHVDGAAAACDSCVTGADHARLARPRCVRAGQWRGMEVAIKTVVFASSPGGQQAQLAASEAEIARKLVHPNIVATYSHNFRDVAAAVGAERGSTKCHLVQVTCACTGAVLCLFCLLCVLCLLRVLKRYRTSRHHPWCSTHVRA